MKLALILFVFAIVLSLGATAQDTWIKFNRPQYTISYPNNWRLDTSGRANSDVFIFSEKESADDDFTENINVMKENVQSSGLDFEQYLELNQKNFSNSVPNAKLISSERFSKDGMPYQKLIWSFQYDPFTLETTQYYFMNKGMVYVVTFSCEKGKVPAFAAVSQKIMNSFKLR